MRWSVLRQVLRWLLRFVWLLSAVSGIVIGLYIVYVSLLGDPMFGIVGRPGIGIDGWWWALGILMIVQSVWRLGTGP